MSDNKTDNNGKITERTRISLPLQLVVILLFMAITAVAGYKFGEVNEEMAKIDAKKIDREEYYRDHFRDSLERCDTNRKLDLLLEYFDINPIKNPIKKKK